MIHLRPQRVYKPSALSYLGNPSDIADSIIDRYLNKDLYRLRIETPRGTSITADNSQITCYAHIFDKEDGTELTDLLKGRGFRPTWLLDDKPIDSTRISEEGYKITLETDHLPAIFQTVTLQARDTDILLALTTDENQKRIYSQLIELCSIPTHLIKTSEKLLNISRLDKIRIGELEELRQDFSKRISDKLEELHKNPLTISEEGYWRIWDIKQHQYVTTEYQSRGEKGEPGEKGDTPNLSLDSQYRLVADGQLVSAVSLKGDRGETGARGATGQTGAKGEKGDQGDKGEKGDTPNLSLDSQCRLVADGQLVSAVSLKGDRGETGARGATGQTGAKGADGYSPSPDEVLREPRFSQLLSSEVTTQVTPVSRYTIHLINETQSQLCNLQVLGMSDGGVIEVKRQASCVQYDIPTSGRVYTPQTIPKPTYEVAQIPLTLRSSHDALSSEVGTLRNQLTSCRRELINTKQALSKLEATTKITPVTNCDLRKRGSTLYPQYGDWLLTSDTSDLYISLSGLRAEIGRSIYIQTRRRVYIYTNNQSFYGLPGNSTRVNQWLSNNTTYRFVRVSSDSWCVTSSPSPYPWT